MSSIRTRIRKAAVIVGCLAIFLATPAAAADPGGRSDTRVTPSNWGQFSTAELSAMGIVPGMAPEGVEPPKAVAEDRITTQDASGCDLTDWPPTVCIYVLGDSTYIQSWDTSYSKRSYGCHFAAYWQGSTIIATTNSVCGNGPFWAYWHPMRDFSNGVQLCNTWSQDSGRPCIRIVA